MKESFKIKTQEELLSLPSIEIEEYSKRLKDRIAYEKSKRYSPKRLLIYFSLGIASTWFTTMSLVTKGEVFWHRLYVIIYAIGIALILFMTYQIQSEKKNELNKLEDGYDLISKHFEVKIFSGRMN